MSAGAIFDQYLRTEKIYAPAEVGALLDELKPHFDIIDTKSKHKYYNVPASFDIETSSFHTCGNEKTACMYEWTFGICGAVVIGRTWEEFQNVIDTVVDKLGLSPWLRLVVGIHNLAYEFQWFRKRFEWFKTFSLEQRKPIYAITDTGVEFRCTYLLSGYSLAKLGENLTKYHVEKLVGALDYDKIRHYKTPLTADELAYCVNDVRVVMAYIQEQIEQCGDVSRIPLTKTGFVRRYCRRMCFYDKKDTYKRQKYKEVMKGLRLTPDEFTQLERAFQGGFTHASPFATGKIIEGVTSFDFTSSYPYVMVAYRFPMSSSEVVKVTKMSELRRNLKLYCCVFDVQFVGLQSKVYFDSYISRSRCWGVKQDVTQNGRVVCASELWTTITDVDFEVIEQCYEWENMRVVNFRRYKRGYLPTDLVKAILKLYEDKTTLKGVEGKEIEYLSGKENLNSCYGMAVTNPLRDTITYNGDEWGTEEIDTTVGIEKYNNDPQRFLYFPWGVFVTAFARRNLWSGILEFGRTGDYAYSDTDSVKVTNASKHEAYLKHYNADAIRRLQRACEFHNIPFEKVAPRTKDGIEKPLGVWDFDGHYSRFKTLGAKRYMVEYSDDERNKKNDRGVINITVSGLNKKKTVPYLIQKYGRDGAFDAFNDELYVPPEFTGKNTHTYIDDRRAGVVTDYMGNTANYDELSSVHLEASDYSLSISDEYVNYFLGIQETAGII